MIHDGSALTVDDAILRHGGQAEGAKLKYQALTDDQKAKLLAFLHSM